MYHKPFLLGSKIGRFTQSWTIRLALFLGQFTERMDYGAKFAQHRKVLKKTAREIHSMQRPYSIRQVKELRAGRSTLAVFEHVNRAGEKRIYFTVSRENKWGRTQIMRGTEQDLRDFRQLSHQFLMSRNPQQATSQTAQQSAAQGEQQERQQPPPKETRQQEQQSQPKHHQQRHRRQKQRHATPQPAPESTTRRTPQGHERRTRSNPVATTPKPTYALVHICDVNPDGSAKGQVIGSYVTLEALAEAQKKIGLKNLHVRVFDEARKEGEYIRVVEIDRPEVAVRLQEIRDGQEEVRNKIARTQKDAANVGRPIDPDEKPAIETSQKTVKVEEVQLPESPEAPPPGKFLVLCKIISVNPDGASGSLVVIKTFPQANHEEAKAHQAKSPDLVFLGKALEKEPAYGTRFENVPRVQTKGIRLAMDQLSGRAPRHDQLPPAKPPLENGHLLRNGHRPNNTQSM